MKQLLQHFSTGKLEVLETPLPNVPAGHVLIQTNTSLISAGTEKMLVDFAKSSLLEKARKQPERVKQVLNKVKTDGLATTYNAVKNKLDTPIPLGYCNVGTVIEVGEGITEFKAGDRVASNGSHAEVVWVPKNLCAHIPDEVSDEDATFTVIGAIGLQGIRLLDPTLGETVVVLGLGLIGQLSVQILKANGCNVIGIDTNPEKVNELKAAGITALHLTNTEAMISELNKLYPEGVDSVLITASTASSDPLHLSAQVCRHRGKVVLVGVIGNEWSRNDFYKKEIQFQVSCSYGPGRYDINYEQNGLDYPIGHVRWTEQRNFSAILTLLKEDKLSVSSLVTHKFNFSEVETAYNTLTSDPKTIGILLNYTDAKPELKKTLSLEQAPTPTSNLKISIIGAGNFTKCTLLPELKKVQKEFPFTFHTLMSNQGSSSTYLGKKYKFNYSSTNLNDILESDTDLVIITTQHNSHAEIALQCIRANKHVFVEKPLCLNESELNDIKAALKEHPNVQLIIGFNRRFSPHTIALQKGLSETQPMSIVLETNAGHIPNDHWTQSLKDGGGRIIGEAIHFIDLARHLTKSAIKSINTVAMAGNSPCPDTVSISLKFENGSIATIHYLANGHKQYPKETVTLYQAQNIAKIDNYKSLKTHGFKNTPASKKKQDKGHYNLLKHTLTCISNGSVAMPFSEIEDVHKATFTAHQQALNCQ